MNRSTVKKLAVGISLIAIFISLGALTVYAADPPPSYTPLALPQSGNVVIRTDLAGLFIDVFKYTIAASAALAVFMITLGGVQYMSTDAWTGKSNGVNRMRQAIIGLLLVILCFLILQTINPKIVDIGILGKIGTTKLPTASSGGNDAPQQKWCAPIFKNDSNVGFNQFIGFDCSKKTAAACTSQTIPYYNPGGTKSRWCVAVFNQAGTKTAKEFESFNCSSTTYNQCEGDTKNLYIGATGRLSRYCVAVFNKDGSFKETDCLAKTYNECESNKKPYWVNLGFTVTGTIKYTDGTSGQFNGCFQKYTLGGTLNYSSGESHGFNGCFQNYTTSGEIPGKGSVSSQCITEEAANELQYN